MIRVNGHHKLNRYFQWSRRTYPAPLGPGGVGSIPANSDAQNVPSFRRWRFVMKLSPFFSQIITFISYVYTISYTYIVYDIVSRLLISYMTS